MIAIGGSIGTGLFVGSGSALRTGGPAGLLIAYILIGTMIFCTVMSLGELAVTFPVSGAFVTYNSRFVDPSWGFAMAWNYAMQWLVVLPLELVAASITIKYWDADTNPAAYVVIFYVFIVFINFLVFVVMVKQNSSLVPLKLLLSWVSSSWVLFYVPVVVQKVVTLVVRIGILKVLLSLMGLRVS